MSDLTLSQKFGVNFFTENPVVDCGSLAGLNTEFITSYPLRIYDRILVRSVFDEVWLPAFFSTYVNCSGKAMVLTIDGQLYSHCVAYIGNEYLAFDNDEPEEFYRNRLMKNADILHEKIQEAIDSIGK